MRVGEEGEMLREEVEKVGGCIKEGREAVG